MNAPASMLRITCESSGRRALATPTFCTRSAISLGENASNPRMADMAASAPPRDAQPVLVLVAAEHHDALSHGARPNADLQDVAVAAGALGLVHPEVGELEQIVLVCRAARIGAGARAHR